MAELILTIPSSPAGTIAIEHLSSNGQTEFGCEYLGELSRAVADLAAADFLRNLPFTLHRIATEDGQAASAMNRILTWHSREIGEWPHGRVDAVEPNFRLYTLAALGLPFHLGGDHSTYLSLMRVPNAHAARLRGSGVRVAILDSGLDAGAGVTIHDFFDVENAAKLHPVPPAPVDNDGHGTAMAELIHDVAPDAEVYIVRVLDSGSLNLWNLLAGVSVAIADCEADIVNLSIGFTTLWSCAGCGGSVTVRSLAFEKLANTATPTTSKLPVYVAATGNSSSTTGFEFPASSPQCIAVGAVDSGGTRSSFSSYGTTHKRYLMAPGGQGAAKAFTEHVGTSTTGNACAGTSVSAAYVSGMLALFRSDARYTYLKRDKFIDAVLSTHCVVPPHASGKFLEYGSGIIEY